jgi:hypothetical protein
MNSSHRIASVAVALTAVFASTTSVALAIPPDGPPRPCPPGTIWNPGAGECVEKPPKPAPAISPAGNLDLARQTTDRNAIHVVGWTADGDAPLTPLTVRISVDGTVDGTFTADASRPDVAAAFPKYGAAHGYDVVVPASPTAQQVCVTAVNVGSGSDSTRCQQVDDVVSFDAHDISYDRANATIAATNVDELDKVTHTNKTTVQQDTTISGQRTVTDTHGWSTTFGVTVSMASKVSFFGLVDGNLTVTGSASFTQNGSTSETRTFSWQQPVHVPAKSQVVATVAVTRSTLVVPYTLSGDCVYRSGARAAGTVAGTYHGVSSNDLEVKLAQFNLDGTPAARPVPQPEAMLLQES